MFCHHSEALLLSGSNSLARPCCACRLDVCAGKGEDVAAAMEAALPSLTALTQLVLASAPTVPAALASLPRLARFGWTTTTYKESQALAQPGGMQLPSGAWLASLQELNAPAALVDASLAVLAPAATPSLRGLSIPSSAEELLPVQARILAWASGHPALRRLDINWVRS